MACPKCECKQRMAHYLQEAYGDRQAILGMKEMCGALAWPDVDAELDGAIQSIDDWIEYMINALTLAEEY